MHIVYRAKSALQACTEEAYNANAARMPAYFRELEQLNPGSTARIKWEADGRFKRAFCLLAVVFELDKHCVPVSAVDSVF